jgi:hypothetical protein
MSRRRVTIYFDTVDPDELALTIRALREMRDRAEVTRAESDAVTNFLDYLETEANA